MIKDIRESKILNAKIGNKVLENADKFFSGTIETITTKMLQNSRRAGATEVHVTIKTNGSLIFHDNGKRLDYEAAENLMTFGRSHNNDEVEFKEDPAGMGFFALSSYDVEIQSKNWILKIPKGTFTGSDHASIENKTP